MAHEGQQAFYKISEENGVLTLKVKVELPDVQKCLEQEGFCGRNQEFNWCAAAWISNLMTVSIDGNPVIEELQTAYEEEGHLIFSYSLGEVPEAPSMLEIESFCFLGSFNSYENFYQISLGKVQQGYKLSENRTKIKIDLTTKS